MGVRLNHFMGTDMFGTNVKEKGVHLARRASCIAVCPPGPSRVQVFVDAVAASEAEAVEVLMDIEFGPISDAKVASVVAGPVGDDVVSKSMFKRNCTTRAERFSPSPPPLQAAIALVIEPRWNPISRSWPTIWSCVVSIVCAADSVPALAVAVAVAVATTSTSEEFGDDKRRGDGGTASRMPSRQSCRRWGIA